MITIDACVYQPTLFRPIETNLSKDNKLIVAQLLNLQAFQAVAGLSLINKAWHDITMRHPLLWLAQLILQLQKSPGLENEDQANFEGVDRWRGDVSQAHIDLIKGLDPFNIGLHRLLSLKSDFFEKVSPRFYLPLLSDLNCDIRALFLPWSKTKKSQAILEQLILQNGLFTMQRVESDGSIEQTNCRR